MNSITSIIVFDVIHVNKNIPFTHIDNKRYRYLMISNCRPYSFHKFVTNAKLAARESYYKYLVKFISKYYIEVT